jgi:basic amino acid/polyamine antiporter, APA family
VIAATTLAFFAMVGFEDSVNMVEECKEPRSIFPKILLTGLLITGLIYVLVSISPVTLVAPDQLGEGETPLLQVVQAGAPGFPLDRDRLHLLAFGLITFVGEVPALGGTTALLLLCIFTVVKIAVLVLRKEKSERNHFRTPTFLPVIGALACAFLAGPWTGRDPVQYKVAGILIGIDVVLWVVTVLVNRATGQLPTEP